MAHSCSQRGRQGLATHVDGSGKSVSQAEALRESTE
jgi:hypothetical protein